MFDKDRLKLITKKELMGFYPIHFHNIFKMFGHDKCCGWMAKDCKVTIEFNGSNYFVTLDDIVSDFSKWKIGQSEFMVWRLKG